MQCVKCAAYDHMQLFYAMGVNEKILNSGFLLPSWSICDDTLHWKKNDEESCTYAANFSFNISSSSMMSVHGFGSIFPSVQNKLFFDMV